ncbi:unnamed protein product [Adineta ricciae]|uniref:Uncharacterized protein n=1 Tax=Adineta ricciae TaxID=249248 RepID=A0A814ZH56_ADIRI|nr:unnamed protein product [Adineta ricciae]CAF1472525.1 unnamed protein product [Adineta ricciae]
MSDTDLDWTDSQVSDFSELVRQARSVRASKWKQDGIVVAGDDQGTAGDANHQLNTPYELAFDTNNQFFYVADHENGRIQRFSVNNGDNNNTGMTALKIDDGTASHPWFPDDKRNKPSTIFIDGNDNIYVAEMYHPHRILKLSPDKTSSTLIDTKDNVLQSCAGIYVDKQGNIYVSDWQQYAVLKFDKNGEHGEIVAGGNFFGDGPDQFDHPTGIFVAEKTGNIYVADYLNHRIQRWSPGSKEGVTVCGGNGAGFNPNQLNHPCSVIVDEEEEYIYVGDSLNARVVRWTAGAKHGEVVVGGIEKTQGSNTLCRVGGIKFDRDGNLYVTDIYRNQIRKYLVDN